MNALLVYMFKAALYLSAFYFIYSILLSRDTSYARNRIFILLSMAGAMILPCFALQNVRFPDFQIFGKLLSEVLITGTSGKAVNPGTGLAALTPFQIINILYLTGAAIFAAKLISDLVNLIVLIVRQKNKGSHIIRFHGFNTAGFSAMGYVFINTRLSPEEADEIIRHERNHLKRNHFIDIIFVEIVKAFQWFNPSVYLFNRSIRAIHEYQADQECLTSGIPVVNYQSLLLNQVFRTNTFTLSNSFSNPSLVRKRMIMMTKKRTSSLAGMKLLFVIPVIGFVFLIVSAFGKNSTSSSNNNSTATTQTLPEASDAIPFVQVDEMPMFPGGDAALLKYLGEHSNYPEKAKENNIQGRVVVRFCITEKGKITRISILQGVDPEIDAEAIRVIGTLPDFIPGRNGGKAVPVWYMVPLTFVLK
jgi:TonB family protein